MGNTTDTFSINRYIYGNDNPLRYKDPSGNWSDEYIEELSRQRIANGLIDRNSDIMEKTSIVRVGIDIGTNIANGISVTYNKIGDWIKPNRENNSYLNYSFQNADTTGINAGYTKGITNLLIQEEVRYANIRRDSYNYQIVGDIVGGITSIITKDINGFIYGDIIGSGASRLVRYIDFYQNEKTYGRLDIKQPNNWEKAFGSEISYPNGGKFVYDDIIIDQADLGNIVYGYWGKTMGFSDKELFYGGGFANKGLSWDLILGRNYGDEPEDIAAIMKGIELYNEVNRYMYGC